MKNYAIFCRNLIFLFLLVFFHPNKVDCQATIPFGIELPNAIPPSPTPANLGEYGNTNISLYTGSPEVNIPLIEIVRGDYKMPISLNYKSGGIKVNDIASWVGLGWSLMAGGCIMRTQNGLADELPLNGYINTPVDISSLPVFDKLHYFNGLSDSEADNFYFSFPGRSGSFYLLKDNTIKIANGEELKIERTLSTTPISFADVGGDICIKKPILYISWVITDEQGTKYTFDQYEKTVSFGRFYETDFSTNFNDNDPDITQTNPAINTWYLSKIETINNEVINFEYDTEDYEYDIPGESKRYVSYDPDQFPSWCCMSQKDIEINGQRLYFKSKRLSKIYTSEISVEFNALSERADLRGTKYLDNITIKNINGNIIKQFELKYKYAYSNQLKDPSQVIPFGTNTYSLPCDYPISFYYRLMLVEVNEKSGSLYGNKYELDYFSNHGLPNRASIWKDHWGYSNGPETDPYRRMHPFKFNNLPGYQTKAIVPEKDPNIDYAKQLTLKSITYPTGGHTEFDFELHECITDLIPNPFLKIPAMPLSINYNNYDYLNYNSEMLSIDEGNHLGDILKCYYIEFTVNELMGFDYIDLDLEDLPVTYAQNAIMGFFIDKIENSGHTRVWTLSSNLLAFSPPSTWTNPSCSMFTTQVFSGKQTITLQNGTYRLYFYPVSNPVTPLFNDCQQFQFFSLTIGERYEEYYSDVKEVGGLRIKTVTDFSDLNTISKKRSYEYTDDNLIPSGQLINFPVYIKDFYEQHYEKKEYDPCFFTSIAETTLHYKVLSTETNYPLLTTSGSYIGYSQVKETFIDELNVLNNGYTKYLYTTSLEYPDLNYDARNSSLYPNPYPYPPTTSYDFLRGKLKERKVFNNLNEIVERDTNQYQHQIELIQSQKTDYKLRPGGNYTTAWGCIEPFTTCMYGHLISSIDSWYSSPPNTFTVAPLTIVNYFNSIGIPHLTQTKNFKYTPQGVVITQKDYSYKGNRLRQTIESTSDPNKSIKTENKYPDDFPNTTIYLEMVNRNLINNIIEQQATINGTQNIQITRSYYNYTNSSNDFIDKTRIEQQIRNSSFENKVIFSKYDYNGKLIEFSTPQGIVNTVIRSQSNLLPIAAIKNSTFAESGYTGFENGSTDGWQFASSSSQFINDPSNVFTGKSSLSVGAQKNFIVGLNALDHSGYKFCIWLKGPVINSTKLRLSVLSNPSINSETVITESSGSWQYIEVELPFLKYSSLNIDENFTIHAEVIGGASSTYVDDARFYPMDAEMTTYTYEPLIGISSSSDVNNKPTYYVYDSFGRLKYIKDFKKNILKKYDYHFRPQ